MNTTTLESLRAQSESAWNLACETAGIADCGERHDQAREDAASDDATAALALWDEALGADTRQAAIEALKGASRLAASWGDDSHEKKAIELLSEG